MLCHCLRYIHRSVRFGDKTYAFRQYFHCCFRNFIYVYKIANFRLVQVEQRKILQFCASCILLLSVFNVNGLFISSRVYCALNIWFIPISSIPISSTILTIFPFRLLTHSHFVYWGYFHSYAAYSRSQWWYIISILYFCMETWQLCKATSVNPDNT